MDDDDEDFEALFFSEARELLDALQEHLNLLADDAGDTDTVHAAFRAVHSVKGGAAAFGFEKLIAFAHIFETVMDLVREDHLEIDETVSQVLLRSGDMMQLLVEAAEKGEDSNITGLGRLQAELEVLAGQRELEDAPEVAVAAGAPEIFDSAAEADPDPAPDADADAVAVAAPAAGQEPDELVISEFAFRITPEEDFFASGHDMLRLIRSARTRGLAEIHAEGEIPRIEDFDPAVTTLSWELVFRTESTPQDIRQFLEIYAHTAQIEYEGPDSDSEDDVEDDEPGGGGSAGGGGDDPEELERVASPHAADTPLPSAPPAAAAPAMKPAKAEPAAAAAKPAEKAAPQSGPTGNELSKSLRVEITRIDRLVNLVGEMLITQAALAQQLSEVQATDQADRSDLAHAVETMNRQLRELQESVMAIRAQPVKSVFRRMPRVVRDLAEKLGKQAKITLEGEYTEVDATVIEELSEPLTHMIRNSMDHGLEQNDDRVAVGKPRVGNIRLAAEHRGERVIITVEDDGRGINRERVLEKAIERGLVNPEDSLSPEDIDMLIFHPGFSTAAEVSSVSGRGVGMDVVKKKIVTLGGRVNVVSTPGQGSRFVITLPLTLAVMDGMTIGVGDQKYILPLSTVVEALHVSKETGKRLPDGTNLLERRGEYLRLISLRRALNLPECEAAEQMAIIVDTETQGHIALTVDELIGQRQIVLKSLEANFKKVDGISGATILGDGQVALILDVPQLMQTQGVGALSAEMFH